MTRIIYRLSLVLAILAGIVLIAELVSAATTIEITITDAVTEGPEGSIHRVAGPVEVGEAGLECLVELIEIINASNHSGTNGIVRSGASSVTFAEIEMPGASMGGVGGFILDGPVEVFTQLGVDEIASIGYVIRISCPDVPTTTTTTPDELPTTTTTVPQTTTSTVPPPTDTTTTEPPPVGPIDAGGGSTAAVIVNGQDPAILFYGGGVLLMLGVILGIAALAPKVRDRWRR